MKNLFPFSTASVATGVLAMALMAALTGCVNYLPPKDRTIAAELQAPEDATRNALDPEWLRPSTDHFTLGPGDRIEIEVAGDPGTTVETVVGPDGKVYYQMLGGIDVWGMTLAQARAAIEKPLAEFYREPPKVHITVREVGSKRVWMLGRFATPGVYPLTGPMTLLDAIAQAGGPAGGQAAARLSTGQTALVSSSTSNSGDLSRAFVVRQGKPLPVNLERLVREGDTSQNIYLQPDDLIYLPTPRSQDIYVMGAVRRAQAVNAASGATLISAIAAAGGPIEYAYLSHVAVVRGPVNDARIGIYDYRQIISGKAKDVRLEPNDIVYIPTAPYRVIGRYLDLIVSTFVRTVGVNAGAKAASVETDLGLNVIVPTTGP